MGLFDKVKTLFTSEKQIAPAVKPGRNDLCWCGSGKKYKKCHLPGEQEKEAERACSMSCGPT